MRIAIGIEYDGTHFSGWQTQRSARSVQAVVESALSAVADHSVTVTGAGRTDAGVHALAQVAHFDTTADRAERAWLLGGNSNLPPDVNLLWARRVDGEFDARRTALERSYRYWILTRTTRSSLLRDRVCWAHRALDVAAMNAGAQHLLGEHDFNAFRAAACQSRSSVRELRSLEVVRHGELIRVDVSADAFLHHMVRNIVGVLLEIGAREADPVWAREVLETRDRRLGGITAPATGLYLTAVRYPPAYALPSQEAGSDGVACSFFGG